MVVRGGDPEPSGTLPGVTLLSSTGASSGPGGAVRVSANGIMLWSTSLFGTGSTANDTAYYIGTPGSFSFWIREGDLAPGTVGATFSSSAASSITATLDADGRFESLQVAPGIWRLEVRFDEQALLTLRDIIVEAGAVLDLGQLDLRPRITPLHIDVVDERGEPLPRAMVTLLSERGAWPTEEYTSRAGRASFVTLGAPLDLRVWSPGRRSLELKAVASHQRVTLPAGIAVEFVFPRDLPPLAPPLEFTLSVTDEDAESLDIIECFATDWRTRYLLTSRTAPVGPSERWTLHLPHAGDYMVLGHVRDTRTLRSVWSSPRPLGPISIDGAAPAPVHLSLDTASLSSALAAHAALSTSPSQR